MGDVVEVLGISRTALEAAKLEKERNKIDSKLRRPKGISNEVFQLLKSQGMLYFYIFVISDYQHSDGTNIDSSNLFAKANIDIKKSRKARRWKWKNFINESRVDSLKLSHWEKVPRDSESLADNGTKQHAFSKFNRTCIDYRLFSIERIQKFCESNKNFTVIELSFLVFLTIKYNLNWFIIYEKWFDSNVLTGYLRTQNIKALIPRSVDVVELKTEFIRLCKYIFTDLQKTEAEPVKVNTYPFNGLFISLQDRSVFKLKNTKKLKSYLAETDFSPSAESIRIELLDKQQRRSKEGALEANQAIEKIAELDKSIKQYLKNIGDLKKALGLDDEITAEYLKKHTSLIDLFLDSKETPDSETTLKAIHSKRKRYKLRTGVCFRSSTLVAPPSEIGIGPGIMTKISKILEMIGLNKRVMATEKTSQAYNDLRLNILKLVVLSKEVRRLETKKH